LDRQRSLSQISVWFHIVIIGSWFCVTNYKNKALHSVLKVKSSLQKYKSRTDQHIDISSKTGMTADDIICGLENLQALVRDPITKTYAIRLDKDLIKAYIDKWEAKKYIQINPQGLTWTPFIMGRKHHLNYAPPTIAPRENEPELEGGVLVEEQGALTTTDHSVGLELNQMQADINTISAPNGSTFADTMDLDHIPEPTPIDDSILLSRNKQKSPSRSKLTPPEEVYAAEELYARPHYTPPVKEFLNLSPCKSEAVVMSKKSIDKEGLIPPTRFELVPNIPGKRKYKYNPRIFKKRGKFVSQSPSALHNDNDTPRPVKSSSTLRRTRSGLVDSGTSNDRGGSPRQSLRGIASSKAALNGHVLHNVVAPDMNAGQPATPAFTNGSYDNGDYEHSSRHSSPVMSDIPGAVPAFDTVPRR